MRSRSIAIRRIATTTALAGLLAGCLPVPLSASPIAIAFHPLGVFVSAHAPQCRIDVERRGGMVHLSGLVSSQDPIVARATMNVRRSGSAGTSNNRQGGVFAVSPGQETVVGRVIVNASASDRLSADLSIDWDGGSSSCAYP